MAEPTQQYTPSQQLAKVDSIIKNPKYKKQIKPEDFAGNIFKYNSEYNDDLTSKLIRAKENIAQGVGLPGALLGVYALGNKPKKGKSRLPGVVGAVGGAYLGKTLYDFAANNENTKKYITDFTNFVNKHTGGVGGQYVPMAAQALGGLLGYGLLKQSNYNMSKQAASGTKVPWGKYLIGGGALGGGGTFAYSEYQDWKDKILTLSDEYEKIPGYLNNNMENITDSVNNLTEGSQKSIKEITDNANNTANEYKSLAEDSRKYLKEITDNANNTVKAYEDLAKNSQGTLDEINKNVNDKMPTVLTLGGVGIGLGVGVPLATYLVSKKKKSKKNKRYAE